jgi:hypothetical protein
MGGLTPCPTLVDAALDPTRHPVPNAQDSILDLGCGSGIWTLEMVRTTLLQRLLPYSNVFIILGSPVPSRVRRGCRPRSSWYRHGDNSYQLQIRD